MYIYKQIIVQFFVISPQNCVLNAGKPSRNIFSCNVFLSLLIFTPFSMVEIEKTLFRFFSLSFLNGLEKRLGIGLVWKIFNNRRWNTEICRMRAHEGSFRGPSRAQNGQISKIWLKSWVPSVFSASTNQAGYMANQWSAVPVAPMWVCMNKIEYVVAKGAAAPKGLVTCA